MKHPSFIKPTILFIIGILYIIFRYYMKTDYKASVDSSTFIISVLTIMFFWNIFLKKYI
jgi:hypothetical protein